MEKQTVFIKRYPSKGELPNAEHHVIVGWNEEPLSTRIANRSDNGYWFLSDDACDCDEPDYWLKEIEIPSEEEIEHEEHQHFIQSDRNHYFKDGFKTGANFILNYLKVNTNETDKI